MKHNHCCALCYRVDEPTVERWILYPTCALPYYKERRCEHCLEDTFASKEEATAVLIAWKLTQ